VTKEIRTIHLSELRVEPSESGPIIEGYAAMFDSPSVDFGQFREQITRGAFGPVLDNDVRALYNHDPNYVLGRSGANTLTMEQDERGLKVRITPPDTAWARDLLYSMKRGDINQMSFAFSVDEDGQMWDYRATPPLRTINRFAKLYDVSVVTYPAYEATAAHVRMAQMQEINPPPEDHGERMRRTIAIARRL
jgi:HK97 family phage prohead protease